MVKTREEFFEIVSKVLKEQGESRSLINIQDFRGWSDLAAALGLCDHTINSPGNGGIIYHWKGGDVEYKCTRCDSVVTPTEFKVVKE